MIKGVEATLATGAMSRMKLKIKIRIERRVYRVSRYNLEQRVTVRRSLRNKLGGDIAAEAWPVFYHELLAEVIRQPLPREARDDIGRAASRKRDNQTDWL